MTRNFHPFAPSISYFMIQHQILMYTTHIKDMKLLRIANEKKKKLFSCYRRFNIFEFADSAPYPIGFNPAKFHVNSIIIEPVQYTT